MLEGSQRPHTWWWRSRGHPRHPMVCQPPGPPSGSPSDFISCRKK
jgi:hypothetical protein